MHILRANYQAAMRQRCLEPSPSVPNPAGRGWTTDEDGNLEVEWMRGSYSSSLASACAHANYQCVLASAMASSARTCVDYEPD